MMRDIKAYIAPCAICQENKYSTFALAGLFQPLPVPEKVWEDISMDFIEGFDSILVVV